MPIKPKPFQSQCPAENSDLTSRSVVNGAKGVDSAPDARENTDTAVETSHDVPFPMGFEIDPIDDPSQYEMDLFPQPQSAADFEYWAKMPVWTLNEAIALSFGKNPDQVDWDLIEIYRKVSPIAQDFWNCRRLVLRYQATGQLSDRTYPTDYIEWAQLTETPIPVALVEAVSKRWHQTVNWRQFCYDQKAHYDDQIGKWKSAFDALHAERQELADDVDELRKAITERDNSISQLRECQHFLEIAHGEAESDNYIRPDKPLHTKERESLVKMAIGLAVGGYGYDPAQKRSPVINEIMDDMAEAGILLCVDTLRKFLRAGAEFLPSATAGERPKKRAKRRDTRASSARRSS